MGLWGLGGDRSRGRGHILFRLWIVSLDDEMWAFFVLLMFTIPAFVSEAQVYYSRPCMDFGRVYYVNFILAVRSVLRNGLASSV